MKKLLLVPSIALFSLAACNMNRVKGNGHVISKSFTDTGFKDVDVSSSLRVYLKQGNDYSVKIDAEDNILELMKVRTEGDVLKIGFRDNISASPTREIKVYITAPEFRNLEASGACSFISQGSIKGNVVKLDLSGASSSQLEVETNKLEVDASGASEISLKGKTTYFSVDGSGSTEIHSFPLLAEHTKVSISGSGDAEVYAGQSLDVEISGAGDVTYKGTPATINKDISGAGSISQAR
jgi:hypothetical protein